MPPKGPSLPRYTVPSAVRPDPPSNARNQTTSPPHFDSIYLTRPKKLERIAETMQIVPACCREDTRGKAPCGLVIAWLIYDFFTRVPSILLLAGLDDNGNTHFSESLRRRGRWGTASGVCLVPPALPLFGCGYSIGLRSESDLLVDHRDEFCRLSMPSTRLFGRHSAEWSHHCRETKPTRARATGSPIAP
jgi:hypothetical protein